MRISIAHAALEDEYVRAGAKCDDPIINLIGCNNSRRWRLALDLDQMAPDVVGALPEREQNRSRSRRNWLQLGARALAAVHFRGAYFGALNRHPQMGAHPSNAGGIS